MGIVTDFLASSSRYFPNIITLTLIVAGLFLGKPNWVLVGIGGIITIVLTLVVVQYAFARKLFGHSGTPGMAMIAACSVLPNARDEVYYDIPSIWFTGTLFYIAFIITNAANIYSATPSTLATQTIPVLQRKGMALISIVAALFFLFVVMFSRSLTGCESLIGAVAGFIIGAGCGIGYWYLLRACGADYFPDIHGIMLGVRPGTLHTSPYVCTPR